MPEQAVRSQMPPVFVVGAPRSGTSLLTAMLGSHPNLAAGPETQFFSKLVYTDLLAAAGSPQWPSEAVDLLSSLTLANQSVIGLFGATPREIGEWLKARPPGIAAMLEALTARSAERQGKPRWVEKTPNHILHVDKIREIYPDAPIIRIVRDPRDVGLSARKLPGNSESVLANIYLWYEWNSKADDFFRKDHRAMTVRYESLIEDPEAHLRQICKFINEEFDESMMGFSASADVVSSSAETWKAQLKGGIDTSRLFSWRGKLDPDTGIAANLICFEFLKEFGYQHEDRNFQTRYAYRMSRGYLEKFEKIILADARKGIRWLPVYDTDRADKVIDQPQYRRFRKLKEWRRLVAGRLADTVRLAMCGA